MNNRWWALFKNQPVEVEVVKVANIVQVVGTETQFVVDDQDLYRTREKLAESLKDSEPADPKSKT